VISYRSAQISAEEVLKSVRDAGIAIRDVRTEQSDLEDVFLALTSAQAHSDGSSEKVSKP